MHHNVPAPENIRMGISLKRFEESINLHDRMCPCDNCKCQICTSKFANPPIAPYKSLFSLKDKKENWLYTILTGLTPKSVPAFKMFLPSLFFIDNDVVEIFCTDHNTNRIMKQAGLTPTKFLMGAMLRMRNSYKGMLQQNFHKNMMSSVIDNSEMHEKYLDQVLPSSFNDSEETKILKTNKNRFQKYILHKNKKYIIDSIEEHKINENQGFCSVHYQDGNSQFFNQREFEKLLIKKIPNDIRYIQLYMKEKQDTTSIFTTQYNVKEPIKYPHLFEKAEVQILILIGGLDKHSDKYEDLEVIEDTGFDLMKNDPEAYSFYSTYRIVHYLSMVARIYVKHIKMNWLLNDLLQLYLNQIFEFQTTEISLRPLKFRLPPKKQNFELYKDKQRFAQIYKQLKIQKQHKRGRARSILPEFQNEITLDKVQQKLELPLTKLRKSTKMPKEGRYKISKTIDFVRSYDIVKESKRPKLLNMSLLDQKHEENKRSSRSPYFQKNHQLRNLTSLGKYNF